MTISNLSDNIVFESSSEVKSYDSKGFLKGSPMENHHSNRERLEPYRWLLGKHQQSDSNSTGSYAPYYGDVTQLNTHRVILDSVGEETLKEIAEDSIDLLGTSVAIYELNGDYAFGMFSSGWCRMMDAASRRLCKTGDNRDALDCGCWLCHENCWNYSAKAAMASGQSTDIQCIGGINLYGEPIYAGGQVIGAINIGYGTPPTDSNNLKKLSEKFNIELNSLEEQARRYDPRPQFLIDLAKKRLKASARFIGELVEKSTLQAELKRKSRLLDDTNQMAKIGGWELDANSLKVTWTDETYRIHELPLDYTPSLEEAISFFHPDDRPELKKAIQRALDKGEPYDMKVRFITAKGQHLWTRAQCEPKIVGGKIIKLKGTFQDITEQKKAEEKFKESEKKLHTILDQNPFSIAVIDVNDEKILYWSQSAIETFGHNPSDVSEWYELAYPDPEYREEVIKRWKSYVEKALGSNRAVNAGEYNIVCKDGTTKNCEIHAQFIPGNLIVTLNNITERKRIERSLTKSESLFRGLYNNMTSGAAIYEVINDGSKGSDYIVKSFNQKSLDIEGKTLDQVTGKSLFDLRPNIDDYGLIPAMKQVWETGEPNYFPIKIYDDEVFSNYYENYIFKIPTGEVVTIYNDVTDQKNSELALQESEKRFALAMEFANDGLFDWNLKTNESYYSPVWKRMLGYEDDELPNDLTVWEKLTKPEDVKRSWKMQTELINRKRNKFEIEFKMQHKDGHWVDILSRANAIFDKNNKAVRLIGTHVDISERKKLEIQLLQSQKLESLGNLAGGIAHEFNNILSIIIGNNELILEDLPEWSLSRESSEEIRLASLRARDIVKHLLTFSRQDDSTKKPINMGDVVTESLKLIRSTTPTNIEIREKISHSCLPILGDATQINQILMNLCNNAVDVLPISGGRIEIELCNYDIDPKNDVSVNILAQGKYVKLLVRDNGSGMPKEILDRIFDPYFTTKDVGKGSGIGLAVVHGIVENHRGSIVCESTINQGTIFTILIPAYESPIEEESNKTDILSGNGERILYVDDEPSIAKLGRRHLESLGYDAYSTIDPKEALEMIKSEPNRFNLVISDMAMPNMPGDQLITEILSINSEMPTMICSGYSSRMSETNAPEMGIKAFVMKPLNKAELAKKVRDVLDDSTNQIVK